MMKKINLEFFQTHKWKLIILAVLIVCCVGRGIYMHAADEKKAQEAKTEIEEVATRQKAERVKEIEELKTQQATEQKAQQTSLVKSRQAAKMRLLQEEVDTVKKEMQKKLEEQAKASPTPTATATSRSVTTSSNSTAQRSQQTSSSGSYSIVGSNGVTVKQMVAYFNANGGKYPTTALKKGGAGTIKEFCQIYYEEAEKEGIRVEVAYTQTMKETGWLQYGGDSTIQQFNFAGLGTTGGGVKGNSYPDVRTGVRAQIQHLKAYATSDKLNQTCVDDRYEYVKKGCAPYVEWLGQQENPKGYGWATGKNYGYSIVDMIKALKKS